MLWQAAQAFDVHYDILLHSYHEERKTGTNNNKMINSLWLPHVLMLITIIYQKIKVISDRTAERMNSDNYMDNVYVAADSLDQLWVHFQKTIGNGRYFCAEDVASRTLPQNKHLLDLKVTRIRPIGHLSTFTINKTGNWGNRVRTLLGESVIHPSQVFIRTIYKNWCELLVILYRVNE